MAADECQIIVEDIEEEEEMQIDKELIRALKEEKVKNHKNILSTTKIQKVPEILRRNEDFRMCYEPLELSIGPIHGSETVLIKNELKVRLAAEFIKRTGCTGETLLKIIQENIRDLKKSFIEEVIKIKEAQLARLLFLDGCAILQFIHSFMENNLNKFGINNGQANLIQQDLFLLENQIPFQVFKLLIDLIHESDRMKLATKHELLGFVLMNNVLADTERNHWMLNLESCVDEAVHLLDLLRLVLSMNVQMRGSVSENIPTKNWESLFIKVLKFSCPHSLSCESLTDYLMMKYTKRTLLSISRYFKNRDYSFRNVQELKAAGITLKTSDSCSLKSISFHVQLFFRGHLKLPTLIVDDSTTRKLLNLLAYEMCRSDHETNSVVASYINFLDLLIDNEDDVKDLRAADIIRNRLSSDIEVAKLFNSLGSICVVPPKDIYKGVKRDIEKHYKRKFVIWMAQVYHVHFSSPWTILALLAAITVLTLTAIQAYYAIHPKN